MAKNNLWYWRALPNLHPALSWGLLLTFFVACGLFLFSWFAGAQQFMLWDKLTTLTSIQVPLKLFEIADFDAPVTSLNYLNLQKFQGAAFNLQAWPAIVLMVVVALSVAVTLALSTYLSRVWMYTMIVLAGVWVSSLRAGSFCRCPWLAG